MASYTSDTKCKADIGKSATKVSIKRLLKGGCFTSATCKPFSNEEASRRKHSSPEADFTTLYCTAKLLSAEIKTLE